MQARRTRGGPLRVPRRLDELAKAMVVTDSLSRHGARVGYEIFPELAWALLCELQQMLLWIGQSIRLCRQAADASKEALQRLMVSE
jgi:hypothetical protein